jgi:ribonucleoside-diphosphate reductase beta chain
MDTVKKQGELILLRGLPGAGKTTLAKTILQLRESDEPEVLSADDFFINENGMYEFDFAKIKEESANEVETVYNDVINQEKTFAKFAFRNGSMIGLNEKLLCDYIDWIGDKRMKANGMNSFIKAGANPLPWTQKWIGGSDIQVAPQEVEISSYVMGAVQKDVNENTFSNFTL